MQIGRQVHPRNVGHSGNLRSGRRRDKLWGLGTVSKGLLYLQLAAAAGLLELFCDSSGPWFCDEPEIS